MPVSAAAQLRYGMPEPPRHLIARSRLVDLIDRGSRCALTLVSAPAGTGKTVAVATWARSVRPRGPQVWIALSKLDLSAGMPWALVSAELSRAGVAMPSMGGARPAPVKRIAAAIARQPEPVTLILDCAVDLTAGAVRGLEQLLDQSGDRLRLVLLIRSDPSLPLHRYRQQDALVEVRMTDLAFTRDETRELFAKRGLELPADTLGLVVSRTRGWAAGLILAGMALGHSSDPVRVARDFSGRSGTVAEYLLAEVLNRQTPLARNLLLRTSVAPVLSPELLQALGGRRAEAALEFLRLENAFVEPVPDRRGWYRYHPLFRELLSAQLAYEAPDLARRLQLIAAEWSAQQGLITEAVRSAIDADSWDVAAGYAIGQLAVAELLTPEPTVLRTLLDALPDDIAGPSPALVRAAAAVREGRTAECADHLRNARGQLEGADPSRGAELTLALISTINAALVGDPDAVLDAAAIAEPLLTTDDVAAHPDLAVVLNAAKARALVCAGQLSAAADACTSVAAGGLRAGFEREYVDCVGLLALIAGWRGQNRRAIRLARQALASQDRTELAGSAGCTAAEAALAWVYVEMNDLARARRHVSATHDTSDALLGGVLRITLALAHGRILRSQADLAGARATLVECRERESALPGWLLAQIAAEESVLAGLAGQPAAVEIPVGGGPSAAQTLPAEVDRWLRQAQLSVQHGNEDEAVESLDRALRLAAPERLRRPFLEASPEIRKLRLRRDVALRHGWLDVDSHPGPASRADAGDRPARRGAPKAVLSEPLTAKEREVLGYLAELLTTEEIAGAMFVSVNTIRTHVRNILRKLGAPRRNEAVRRARELGILPS